MAKGNWGKAKFLVERQDGASFTVEAKGRNRWALECLIAAGPKGCTPIETPGPRWSGYVHELRKLGVPIETVREPHGGDFAGSHARYVLPCKVRRVAEVQS